MKVKQKLKNLFIVASLTCSLALGQAGTAFAATYVYQTFDAVDYAVGYVLSAYGISTGQAVGQWVSAYRGYLESINDSVMLSVLNSYDGVSAGKTLSGMKKLVPSIGEWLSKSSHYGTGNTFLVMPSKLGAQVSTFGSYRDYGLSTSRYSECKTYNGGDGYSYLFSAAFNRILSNSSSQWDCFLLNDYYSLTKSVVAYCSHTPNDDRVVLYFLASDASPVAFRIMRSGKDYTGDSFSNSGYVSGDYLYTSLRTLVRSDLPFKVFASKDQAINYLKTGNTEYAFSAGKASLWCSKAWMIPATEYSVTCDSDSLYFPTGVSGLDYSSVHTAYNSGDVEQLKSVLASKGLQVSYVELNPEPEPTEPAPTEPEPTEPAPTEPAPTEPEPTEPAPTEPAPTEPEPTEPAPTEPEPTEPAPTEPEPTEPAPTEPEPTEPAPTEPEPTEPAPTEPAPMEPLPSKPESTNPDAPVLAANGIVAGVEEVAGGMKDGLTGVLPVALPVSGSLFVIWRLIIIWCKLTGGS